MTSKKTTAYDGPIIYVGPSLPNGLLNRNALFIGAQLPKHVQDLADNDADFKSFLIKPSELGKMNVKLKDQTSVESYRFKSVQQKYKGLK